MMRYRVTLLCTAGILTALLVLSLHGRAGQPCAAFQPQSHGLEQEDPRTAQQASDILSQ